MNINDLELEPKNTTNINGCLKTHGKMNIPGEDDIEFDYTKVDYDNFKSNIYYI